MQYVNKIKSSAWFGREKTKKQNPGSSNSGGDDDPRLTEHYWRCLLCLLDQSKFDRHACTIHTPSTCSASKAHTKTTRAEGAKEQSGPRKGSESRLCTVVYPWKLQQDFIFKTACHGSTRWLWNTHMTFVWSAAEEGYSLHTFCASAIPTISTAVLSVPFANSLSIFLSLTQTFRSPELRR